MKKGNGIKVALIISIVILLSLISFVGIYVKKGNQYENIMKEYKLGMELGEKRVVTLKPSKETSTKIYDKDGKEVEEIPEDADKTEYKTEKTEINKDEVLVAENYEESKKIIEKRLKKIGATAYSIKYSEKTGDIIVELSEDDKTDSIINGLTPIGKIEMFDAETKEVLISNENLKKAEVSYYNGEQGTTVYVTIALNKEGTNKLKDITKTYVKKENDSESKKVTLKLDWLNPQTGEIEPREVISQAFDSEIKDGILQVPLGTATTNEELQLCLDQARIIASILNSGLMEIQYEVDGNKILYSEITNNQVMIGIIIAISILAVISLVIIFKYKTLGVLGVISNVGMIACILIFVRIASVTITISAILAMFVMFIVNTIITLKLVEAAIADDNVISNIWKAVLESMDLLLVVLISAIVFVFMANESIIATGMVMFWGLISIIITNLLFTKPLLIATKKD